MKSLSRNLSALIFLLFVSPTTPTHAQETVVAPSYAKWEKDIAGLEERNLTDSKVDRPVLFCGSSSIRLWESLVTDMSPWPSIGRGFGGAKLPDVIHYAPRIIGPHLGATNPNRCRAVVIFVANDIAGKDNDITPTEVADRFGRLHLWIRQQDSAIPVFWIEVTPTEKRWAVWPKIADATRQISQIIDADENTHLIATAGAFLGVDGRPRPDLFIDDMLHLSAAGYQLWAGLIKTQLHLKLGAIKPWQKPNPKLESGASQTATETLAQP